MGSTPEHDRFRSYRTRIALLLAVTLIVLAVLPPAAAAPRDVRLGMHEIKPSLFTDENGQPAGIFIDLIRDIATKEGWNIVYVRGSFQENLNRLAAGEIDLIVAITDTPERQKVYDFNRESAVSTWAQIYAAPGKRINTILDLDGKRVAVLRGDINAVAFRENADKFNIHPVVVEKDTLDEVFAETAAGNEDAAVASRVAGQESAKKYGLPATPVMFYPNSLGFAVPRGKNQDLLVAIDRYLEREKGDPSSYYSQTMQKWFGEKAGWVIPPYILWGFGMTAGLVALFVIMSVVLRREVRRKTGELRRQHDELQAAYAQLTAAEEELRGNYLELGKNDQALMMARKKLSLLNELTFQEIQSGIFSLSGLIELSRSGCSGTAHTYLDKGKAILRSVGDSMVFAKNYQDMGIGQPKWQDVNYVFISAISHRDFSGIVHKVELDDLELYADPMLERAFLNIMEYILSRGAGVSEVRLSYEKNSGGITVLIEDNGPGIPETDKEQIFTIQPANLGGSGLFLAREILSITGISLKETGGAGSGIRFELGVPDGAWRVQKTG
ncbi:MAG: transporter substrate-binding domain-containing protein [Methanoregulaceae archaeon]|nr:transporter substrate-binding domain-containing protein [Methanoregulaceae archaeon]